MEATFKAADHADMDVLLALRREFCRHEEIAFDESRARVALARLLSAGVPPRPRAGSADVAVRRGGCAALGVRALHLEVDHNNPRALAAYLKAGFENRNNFLLTRRIEPPSA